MFGLTQIQERLISLGIMAVMAVSGFFYIEHLGAQKCLRNVEKANVVEERKEDKQHAADVITVQHEGQTLEAIKAAPIAPAPVVRLCPKLHSQTVQGSSAARSSPDAVPPSGGDNSSQPTLWDSTPVAKAGRDADAQIRGLQDYITNVCRPKP